MFLPCFAYSAEKVVVKSMFGKGTYFSTLDGSAFKDGKPENYDDKISSPISFLITNEGTFISHNNGLKKLITLKLGSSSIMHVEHYGEEGNTHNWTFHFGEKNPKNKDEFLVTMTRTRNTLFVTNTAMYWGWAEMEKVK